VRPVLRNLSELSVDMRRYSDRSDGRSWTNSKGVFLRRPKYFLTEKLGVC